MSLIKDNGISVTIQRGQPSIRVILEGGYKEHHEWGISDMPRWYVS